MAKSLIGAQILILAEGGPLYAQTKKEDETDPDEKTESKPDQQTSPSSPRGPALQTISENYQRLIQAYERTDTARKERNRAQSQLDNNPAELDRLNTRAARRAVEREINILLGHGDVVFTTPRRSHGLLSLSAEERAKFDALLVRQQKLAASENEHLANTRKDRQALEKAIETLNSATESETRERKIILPLLGLERGPVGARVEQGEIGLPGPRGFRGDPGIVGPKGEVGQQGQTGATGVQGLKGAPGQNGEKGDVGVPGTAGAVGEAGQSGNPIPANSRQTGPEPKDSVLGKLMQNSDSLEDFAAELAKEIEALEQAQAAGLESGGQHNAGLSATSLGGHGLSNSAGLKMSSAPAPMALSAAHLSTYLAPTSPGDQRIAKLRIIKHLVESQMAPSSSADAYHYYASQALVRGQSITASFMTIAQTREK